VLWCAVVCCGVLWCAVVCCGVLWCAVVCCGVLRCAVTVLRCAALCCAMSPQLVLCCADVTDASASQYFNTFGGSPVACAAGLAVLRVVQRERLQDNARVVGEYMRSQLTALQSTHPCIADVRTSICVDVPVCCARFVRVCVACVCVFMLPMHGVAPSMPMVRCRCGGWGCSSA
jgi:hypothetical protein